MEKVCFPDYHQMLHLCSLFITQIYDQIVCIVLLQFSTYNAMTVLAMQADVLEYYDQTVSSPSGSFNIPAVLRVCI
jgi:hypothetical protein